MDKRDRYSRIRPKIPLSPPNGTPFAAYQSWAKAYL
jgi:hypothetical protein